jgi:hypothetical protein
MNILQRRMFQDGGPSDRLVQTKPVNSELIRYYVQQGYSPLEIQEVYPVASLGLIEQIAKEEGGSVNPAVSLGESFTGSPVVTPNQRADLFAETMVTPSGNLSFEQSASPELPRLEDISVVPQEVKNYIVQAGSVLDKGALNIGLQRNFGMSEPEANIAIDQVTGSASPEMDISMDALRLPSFDNMMEGEQAETSGFISEPLTIKDTSTNKTYKLPGNFVEQIESGLLDGMTLYPIINNLNFEFSQDVKSALERFVQIDEPFTDVMGGGRSFEERRGTFRRPEDIGSATQDIVRSLGTLIEGPIRGIAGLAGEIGGGARLKQKFQESIPDLSLSREDLALTKLLQIPGTAKMAEVQEPVTDGIADSLNELEQQAVKKVEEKKEAAGDQSEITQEEVNAEAETISESQDTTGDVQEGVIEEEKDLTPPVVSSASSPAQVGSVFNNQNFIRYVANLSKGLAQAKDLGSGLALGSAMAAEERGLRDLEEERTKREVLLKTIESGGSAVLKPTDAAKISEENKDLTANIKLFQKSQSNIKNVDEVINIVKAGGATGFNGLKNKLITQAMTFIKGGPKNWENIDPRSRADAILLVLQQENIREILGESGRTISNLDREIIKDVFGNITVFTSEAEIIKKLNDSRTKTLKSANETKGNINANLDFFDLIGRGSVVAQQNSDLLKRIKSFDAESYSPETGYTGDVVDMDMRSEFNQ